MPVLSTAGIAGIDEHPVMLAHDLIGGVAGDLQELVVGGQDLPRQREADHGMRLADRIDLAGLVGGPQLRLGDVRGVFDDLEDLAAEVEDRVVGCRNPDFPPALADALEVPADELAGRQPRPELPVFRAVAALCVHHQAVMAPDDFLGRVAHHGKEVRIGLQDGAVQRELDHAPRPPDGAHLPFEIRHAQLLGGDVARVFDDFVGLARRVQDWVVGGLNPNLPSAFGNPLVLGDAEHARPQRRPERPVALGGAVGRIDEHAVVVSGHLLQPVAHQV